MVPYLVVGRSDFHFRCGTLDFAVTPTQGVGQAGLVEGQPDRLPPGACTSRRRRAAAHVERDGRRPAGGHVHGLGVGARHGAVARDSRERHLVAARGDRGEGRGPVRRHGPACRPGGR